MTKRQSFEKILETIQDKDLRYSEDAYVFAMDALKYARKKFKLRYHVSGEQLLEAMRQLLIKEYGPMALTVLKHWGIKTTEDFGNIVFNLVESKVLTKTEDDNRDAFRNAFDLEEIFGSGYRQQLDKKISRMRSLY